MTTRFTYADPNGAWSEDLGNTVVRLGHVEGFALNADLGASGDSLLSFDDPSGTVGHASDALVGWKYVFVDEMAAPTNDRRLLAALTGARDYTHDEDTTDSLRLGVSRHIETELKGINAVLALDPITGTDGKRPTESVGDRLDWILNSSYLSGLVDPTTTYVAVTAGDGPQMDANDYRPSGTPLQVIEDCALAVGYNCFLIWNDETATLPLLFFDDINTSTAYTSTYRLSNVLADVDSYPTGTIGPTKTFSLANSKLHRDPDRVASKFVVPYRKGWTVDTSSATEAAFIRRGLIAPTVTVKTTTNAHSLGLRLLSENATEADTLTGTVELPAASVNVIREGQRLYVKDSHAPGYSGFNYWRVINRVVKQTNLTDEVYVVDLVMTPTTPPVTCDDPGNVDLNLLHGTVTGYNDIPNWHAPATPANMNDGDYLTSSSDTYNLLPPEYEGPFYNGWQSDLGSAYTVACMDYQLPASGFSGVVPGVIQYSTDASTWVDVPYTISYYQVGGRGYRRFIFTTSHVARYWRLLATVLTIHNLPYGYSSWAGIIGYMWTINGQ